MTPMDLLLTRKVQNIAVRRKLGTHKPRHVSFQHEDIRSVALISHPQATPNLQSVSSVLVFLASHYTAQYFA